MWLEKKDVKMSRGMQFKSPDAQKKGEKDVPDHQPQLDDMDFLFSQ